MVTSGNLMVIYRQKGKVLARQCGFLLLSSDDKHLEWRVQWATPSLPPILPEKNENLNPQTAIFVPQLLTFRIINSLLSEPSWEEIEENRRGGEWRGGKRCGLCLSLTSVNQH